jgi:hypothetical protein
MQFPDYWVTASGVFFVLGSLALIVGIALLVVLIKLVLDLITQMKALSNRVDAIGTKVDDVASKVQQTTTELSVRANGITGYIDSSAQDAFKWVDKLSPYLAVFAVIAKVFSLAKGRKKRV